MRDAHPDDGGPWETFDIRGLRHELNGPSRRLWAEAAATVAVLVFVCAVAGGVVPTLSGTVDARLIFLGISAPLGVATLVLIVSLARRASFGAIELRVGPRSLKVRDVDGSVEVVPFSERAGRAPGGSRFVGMVDRSAIPGWPPATRYAVLYVRPSALLRELPVPRSAFDATLSAMQGVDPPVSPQIRVGPNGVGELRSWPPLP